MRSKWLKLLALVFAFTLVAAACGNDSDDDGGDATADDGDTTGGTDDGDGDGDGGDATADDGETDGDADGTDEMTDDGTDDGTDDMASAMCDATVAGSGVSMSPFFDTASFDPPYSSGALVGGTQLAMLYDVLMRFNAETGEFEPQLAESMESNDDFTVWTLTLRDGIAFDDGTPLDADMVLANIDRYFNPEGEQRIINTSTAFLQFIASSEKVDDLTIEFTLTQPWATFPFVFNDEPGMIVNTNAIGDDAAAFGSAPPAAAGVGPYVLESKAAGEESVFTARDNYWGGPVCIETVTFNLAASGAITGFQTSFEALQNGDVDLAFLRNPTVNTQALADGVKAEVAFQDTFQYIIANARPDAPLADPVLREGIALSIDIDIINERAYGGDLDVHKAYINPNSSNYDASVVEMETDTARGKELIDQAGFTGTLRLLCSTGPEATETALAVEAMLEAQGLDVSVENIPTGDQIAKLATGDYDLGCWGVNAGPDTAISAFVRNFRSDSPSNRTGYMSDEMDQLLSDALAVPSSELPAQLAAISNHLVENFLGVPVGAATEMWAMADNVAGVKQTGSTIILLDDAYLAE